ncbi:zinc ribbon domain-containing protein [Desmospora profundinema]
MVKKDLSVRVHSCRCGYTEDRDLNAAQNILHRAIGFVPENKVS